MGSTLFDMTGKVALITGSSKGIGRAIATAIAGQGGKVALCARRQERLEQVAGVLGITGRNGEVHQPSAAAIAARSSPA